MNRGDGFPTTTGTGWGSDSKGTRAHAKGRLSVFLASLDLLTSFSQGTIRRHECFGASHNRYPKLARIMQEI